MEYPREVELESRRVSVGMVRRSSNGTAVLLMVGWGRPTPGLLLEAFSEELLFVVEIRVDSSLTL